MANNSITKPEDDDQNFIKKDGEQKQESNEESLESDDKTTKAVQESSEVKGIINKLTNLIFPKNNQQRNLDRETGGLEVEERKQSSKDDIWDDRSEEVDNMAENVFMGTGMKSRVNQLKKIRLKNKKEAAEDSLEQASAVHGGIGNSHVARLKNLRQDQSNAHGNDSHGGGFGR